MIYIGNHVSISKGFLAMGKEEQNLGGNTFAFFTRNPRGSNSKSIDKADVDALARFLEDNSFGTLVAHAPYTLNLCSAKEEVRNNSLEMFKADLEKIEMLPKQYFNFHPGSHLGQGIDIAVEQIASALNEVMYENMTTTILLETMAGKGTEVGKSFEELAQIIKKVELKDKIGVCLDTCHVWDGGYDIVNRLDEVLEKFDSVIGIEQLKAVHLNDSKNDLASHKDRHEKLGLGFIGNEAIVRIINHPLLQNKPFILETPNDNAGYKAEIEFVNANLQPLKRLQVWA